MQSNKFHSLVRILLLLIIVIPFVLIFSPFFIVFLISAFVALGLEPILNKVSSRTKRNKYVGFGLGAILFFFVMVPFIFFTGRFVNALKGVSASSLQKSQFVQALFDLWAKVQSFELKIMTALGLDSNIIPTKDEIMAVINPFILDKTKTFLSALPDFGMALFVFFSMLVLFTTRAGVIKRFFVGWKILPVDEIDRITHILKRSCYMILVSTLVIGAIQALVVSVGSLIFGFNEFFLIFTVTFLVSFIPVIGAAPVAIALALISFINGDTGDGVGLVTVALIAGTIDNVLKPYIISGDSEKLHPLVSLFGIVGAIIVFGLPGLLLGPLVLQIGVELGPWLLQKLISTVKADN